MRWWSGPVLIAAALAAACRSPPTPAEASVQVAAWHCGQFPDCGPVLVALRGELAGWRFRCNGGQASPLEGAELPACESGALNVVWFQPFLANERLLLRTFPLDVAPCDLQGTEATRFRGDFAPYAPRPGRPYDELAYVWERSGWVLAGSRRGQLPP